jgi:hypothetical protein
MALDFSVWELTRNAGLWTAINLLAAVGLPVLDDPSKATRYRDAGPNAYVFPSLGPRHVVYVTNDGAVHELWHDTSWHHNPITASVGGGPAVVARPAAYPFGATNTQHIDYIGASDGHVHELWWDNDGWHHRDLTNDVGGPGAAPNGALAGYAVDLYGTQYVDYVGEDGHIHELRWIDGDWGDSDLSDLGGATADVQLPTPPGGICAFFFPPTGTRHVYYYGVDGRFHELAVDRGAWSHTDLAGEPSPGGIAGYPFARQGTRHLLFTSSDASIKELWWLQGAWHTTDLRAASGGPEVRLVPLAGYAWDDTSTQHVFFHGSPSAHPNELVWRPNRWPPDVYLPPAFPIAQ